MNEHTVESDAPRRTDADMARAWREGWDYAMASVWVAKLPSRDPVKDNPYRRVTPPGEGRTDE
jgi:hypothetical protein